MSTCKRCAEIRATKAEDLVLFWSPTQPTDPEWLRREGERIRTLALLLHAEVHETYNWRS